MKKMLLSLHPHMRGQLVFLSSFEGRTQSEIIRQALREYIERIRTRQGWEQVPSSAPQGGKVVELRAVYVPAPVLEGADVN